VLLVADRQTAGRGRLGREWFSGVAAQAAAPGSAAHEVASVGAMPSLTFSLGLPLSPRDWSGLSLAVGVGIVESLHPDLRLKWPNDLWWHERKLAGILIETANSGESCAARYAVLGVGVNIKRPAGTGLSTPPAALEELLPGIDAASALLIIAASLVRAIKQFERHGFAPFQQRFNQRDALAGASVTLSDGTVGIALGVDTFGALQVRTALGLNKITSAEVSLRPMAAPPYECL
jgi:BirA family biotin operon repressor/biotin-[acetyl-CoA-carboxylase] ligase